MMLPARKANYYIVADPESPCRVRVFDADGKPLSGVVGVEWQRHGMEHEGKVVSTAKIEVMLAVFGRPPEREG